MAILLSQNVKGGLLGLGDVPRRLRLHHTITVIVWCCAVLLCEKCPTGALAMQLPALDSAAASGLLGQLGTRHSLPRTELGVQLVCGPSDAGVHCGHAVDLQVTTRPSVGRVVPTPCRSLASRRAAWSHPTRTEQTGVS